MSVDDEELFRQQMGDVKPLKTVQRVALKKQPESPLAQAAARAAAMAERTLDSNPLGVDYVELLDPYYPLEFKRAGVQTGVFRRLKQGKYAQEARLDLHRMTVERARQEVFEFIRQSCLYGLRTVMIVHGKGQHTVPGQSEKNQALLKSYVHKWLPELEDVQAYCSAQPRDGGVGAVYVMLRKSEKKKQENRDRFSRGRTVAGN